MRTSERFFHLVTSKYQLITVVTILACILATIGMKNLTLSNDFRAYFSADNPQLKALETLEQRFTKQDDLFFLIVPKQDGIFNKEALSLILELTNAAWKIPYSQRVASLANYQHTSIDGDDLFVDYLYESVDELTPEKIADIKNISLAEPMLVDSLIPKDGSITGIRVSLALPGNGGGTKANRETVGYAQELIKTYEAKYPSIEILLGGSVAFNVTLGNAVFSDMSTLVVTTYAVIFLLLIVLLRSFLGMIIVFSVITLTIATTLGIFGWLGYTLTPNAGFIPTAIMIIAIGDSVHLIINYYQGLQKGLDKVSAIHETLRINLVPVFITSLTTAIGVLSLNTSDSPPYRDMGNMIAVGVTIAYVLSMVLIPALLRWFPAKNIQKDFSYFRGMSGFAEWVINHRKKLLIGTSLFCVVCSLFVTNNHLTERWHHYFDDSFEITRAINLVNDRLSGLHNIEYMLDSGEEDGIYDVAYLNAIEKLRAWLLQQDNVVHVDTLTDVIKRINQNMHADDPAWYKIPETRELAAQYLLSYEASLPYGLGLDDTIDIKRQAIRISVVLKKMDTDAILAFDQRVQQWVRDNAKIIQPTEGTGLDIIFANIAHRNINSIVFGSILALLAISIAMVITLRSWTLGLISLVPNIAPAAIAYGIWGMFGGYISMALSVVVCISLGIVVDDTVHFMTKYLRARKEHHFTPIQATRYAFNTVGVAMVITSVVLVAGFLVATASHFEPTKELGILLSATIAIALFTDLLMLPPLLIALDRLHFDRDGKPKKVTKDISELQLDLQTKHVNESRAEIA